MSMTLEQRVQQQEDILAISGLKAAYCNAADGGWDGPTHDYDTVASLFAEDGVWDGGIYNDQFVRTADGWKLKELKVTFAFRSKNTEGFRIG